MKKSSVKNIVVSRNRIAIIASFLLIITSIYVWINKNNHLNKEDIRVNTAQPIVGNINYISYQQKGFSVITHNLLNSETKETSLDNNFTNLYSINTLSNGYLYFKNIASNSLVKLTSSAQLLSDIKLPTALKNYQYVDFVLASPDSTKAFYTLTHIVNDYPYVGEDKYLLVNFVDSAYRILDSQSIGEVLNRTIWSVDSRYLVINNLIIDTAGYKSMQFGSNAEYPLLFDTPNSRILSVEIPKEEKTEFHAIMIKIADALDELCR